MYPFMTTQADDLDQRQADAAKRVRQSGAQHVKITVEVESESGTRRGVSVLLPGELGKADLRKIAIEKLEAAVGSLERLEAAK